jgi:hypothetical protein
MRNGGGPPASVVGVRATGVARLQLLLADWGEGDAPNGGDLTDVGTVMTEEKDAADAASAAAARQWVSDADLIRVGRAVIVLSMVVCVPAGRAADDD